MYFVGPHVSAAGGVANAPANARSVGATGFAMFVKNQRQWTAPALGAEEAGAFKAALAENGYRPEQVLPHAGYLINLANPDAAAHAKSMASLLCEIQRCEALGLPMLNLHPGSTVGKISPEEGCGRVAESINELLEKTDGVIIVLENTAGGGSTLGRSFAELARMAGGVEDKKRIGVCIDTAHAFAAGYDIRTREGFERAIDELDSTVGLGYLRGMHLNDSKPELGRHVDRHESLGKGKIGLAPFEAIMRDRRFEGIPLILETPEPELWPEEVRRLLAAAGEAK